MTDDIITRLRSEWPDVKDAREAADALEAKDRQIEALELELKVRLPIQEYKAHLKARIAELEAALKQSARVEASLASRIANLMDALEPFADVKVYPVLEDATRVYDEPITYGDLRAARAAYLGEKKNG